MDAVYNCMRSAIAALQTFIQGIAKPGEEPSFVVNAWGVAAFALAELLASLLGTHWILSQNDPLLYPLLVITLAIGQAGVWTIYMAMCHHGVHGANSRKPWVNALFAEVGSTIALTPGRKKYRKSHNSDHHPPQKLATDADPDYRFLKRHGFRPGQSISLYWRQFWLTLLNPGYYGDLFIRRLKANFVTPPLYRKVMAAAWWVAIFAATWYANLWLTVTLGYFIPVVVGYGISALCQTLSEHRWAYLGAPNRKTFPRLLDVTPPATANPLRWFSYFLRMAFYLYWRLAILSTDLPLHQIHHYKPRNPDWPMVAYSEEAQQDLPNAIWGIRAHFLEGFRSLSEAADEENS